MAEEERQVRSAQGPPSTPSETPSTGPLTDPSAEVDLTDPGSIADRIRDAVQETLAGIVEQLPLIVLGVLVFLVLLVGVRYATRGVRRMVARERFDRGVRRLAEQVSRVVMVTIALLFALSVAGVNVSSVLAALGIAGVAVALAVQSILENFISGMILLMRRPFRPGDQVIIADEREGTVEDVNMRDTHLRDYDGETILIPNGDVLRGVIINLTERGGRRSRVTVGVDYRDDHDAAREVLREAVSDVPGVREEPEPEVWLVELAESSVSFEVRYWTAPDIGSVFRVQDRVLSAAKSALEAEGMTIPWPIRTLVVDPDSAALLERRTDDGAPQTGSSDLA